MAGSSSKYPVDSLLLLSDFSVSPFNQNLDSSGSEKVSQSVKTKWRELNLPLLDTAYLVKRRDQVLRKLNGVRNQFLQVINPVKGKGTQGSELSDREVKKILLQEVKKSGEDFMCTEPPKRREARSLQEHVQYNLLKPGTYQDIFYDYFVAKIRFENSTEVIDLKRHSRVMLKLKIDVLQLDIFGGNFEKIDPVISALLIELKEYKHDFKKLLLQFKQDESKFLSTTPINLLVLLLIHLKTNRIYKVLQDIPETVTSIEPNREHVFLDLFEQVGPVV